jgi:ADP-ribose pyrophosphatase YjhB (NUDIX family)
MTHPGDANTSFSLQVPSGDDRPRLVCETCGFVNYVNPKVVVGSVCGWEGKVLLCRRAIEPRKGFWTIPAGYLEERETTIEGALREAYEEARADIDIRALLAVYSIPRISQVQLIYLAELRSAEVAAGPETLELDLFEWSDIPWDELAFPSVRWALDHYDEVRGREHFAPFNNPPGATGDMRARKAGQQANGL